MFVAQAEGGALGDEENQTDRTVENKLETCFWEFMGFGSGFKVLCVCVCVCVFVFFFFFDGWVLVQ